MDALIYRRYPVEPKGLTGMSGGRLREKPTDVSRVRTSRARMLPLRGPLMRLRNIPFPSAFSVRRLRHFPLPAERSIATLPAVPSGVRPHTRTPPRPERNATNGNRNAFSDDDFGLSQATPAVHRNHRPDCTGPVGGPSRSRYQVT